MFSSAPLRVHVSCRSNDMGQGTQVPLNIDMKKTWYFHRKQIGEDAT